MQKYQELWDYTLQDLSRYLDEELFDELFSSSKQVIKFVNGTIYVLVDSTYIQTKINYTYGPKLANILKNYTDEPLRFKFITKSELISQEQKSTYIEKEPIKSKYVTYLNANYNFESFVVGESNRFAVTNAIKVADQPGDYVNPLYIFGGVGLGKTHLMQAIGNYILDKDSTKKVLYIQASTFLEDYTKAAQRKNMDPFLEKYDNLDVLLIDDIQMLSDGKKSQDQFFNLFNKLKDGNKQIVITSDRPSEQLSDIMDRLTTRFSWGLTVDIKQPNLEHRVNILKRKLIESSDGNKIISDDALEYIANSYSNNIRDLEAGLRRVLSYSIIFNKDITLDITKEALEPLLKNRKQNGTNDKYENLKSLVANFYQVSVLDLESKKRTSNLIVPRHICMYLLKTKYNLPYKKIGQLFGDRDHSTVMSSCAKIEQDLTSNKELKLSINTILKKIE